MAARRNLNVGNLGQVFTPEDVVDRMLKLRRNRGSVLEPSAGMGAFMSKLEKSAVGIEIDSKAIADRRTKAGDFFALPTTRRFDTIIGNPPYVRFRDIPEKTRRLLPMDWFDRRSNLYLFFIAKSMAHLEPGGELIFITPRDFLKNTSAKRLNEELYRQGSFTDFHELGDKKVFDGFTPNCAIWRWVRGRKGRKTSMGNRFCYRDGQIWFGMPPASGASLENLFYVKVGAVSGADTIFANNRHGNVKMVCSTTCKDGALRKMIYNTNIRYLASHKAELMQRKIRKFDESNWWLWGRDYHKREGERIYVNCKTRNPRPFFASEHTAYDGSVLALFPKNGIDVAQAVEKLNKVDWESLGFVCDGRLLFSQKSLQNAPVGDLM